jgi:hypothetical protein
MKKTISFGKIDWYGCGRKINEVEVDVELKDSGKGPELSVCADVWNARRTDIVAGGQILDELDKFKYLGGNELFQKIHRLWKAYHLNDMHAGTPEQEKWLEEHRTWRGDYKKDCECLEKAGLLTVRIKGRSKPYKYGSEWLYWPIPEEDLAEIKEILA